MKVPSTTSLSTSSPSLLILLAMLALLTLLTLLRFVVSLKALKALMLLDRPIWLLPATLMMRWLRSSRRTVVLPVRMTQPVTPSQSSESYGAPFSRREMRFQVKTTEVGTTKCSSSSCVPEKEASCRRYLL